MRILLPIKNGKTLDVNTYADIETNNPDFMSQNVYTYFRSWEYNSEFVDAVKEFREFYKLNPEGIQTKQEYSDLNTPQDLIEDPVTGEKSYYFQTKIDKIIYEIDFLAHSLFDLEQYGEDERYGVYVEGKTNMKLAEKVEHIKSQLPPMTPYEIQRLIALPKFLNKQFETYLFGGYIIHKVKEPLKPNVSINYFMSKQQLKDYIDQNYDEIVKDVVPGLNNTVSDRDFEIIHLRDNLGMKLREIAEHLDPNETDHKMN